MLDQWSARTLSCPHRNFTYILSTSFILWRTDLISTSVHWKKLNNETKRTKLIWLQQCVCVCVCVCAYVCVCVCVCRLPAVSWWWLNQYLLLCLVNDWLIQWFKRSKHARNFQGVTWLRVELHTKGNRRTWPGECSCVVGGRWKINVLRRDLQGCGLWSNPCFGCGSGTLKLSLMK